MEVPSLTKEYHRDVYPAIDPSRPELSAAGKVVLITGGSRGIGSSIAHAFAKASASSIIITGRNQDTLRSVKSSIESVASNQSRVHIYTADIVDQARIDEVFAEVVKNIGRIDIFVANAGYLPNSGPFVSSPLEDLWQGFEVNVKGAMIEAQAFLRSASPNSVLINISSGVAHVRYWGPGVGYSCSKTAGVRIMDHIGAENPSVRVYNVQPGIIKTEMSAKSSFKDAGIIFDSVQLPAAFCVWLASPEAEFLRGKFLYSNWDVEEMKANKEAILKDPENLTMNLVGWFDMKTKAKLMA